MAKILSGEKTIEIRKTRPNCPRPIDVYLYETKTGKIRKGRKGRGKIVGKFTLKTIDKFIVTDEGIKIDGMCSLAFVDLPKETGMSLEELHEYIGIDRLGWAWYIDNLEIFDEPIRLGGLNCKFKKAVTKTIDCGMDCPPYDDEVFVNIIRPPWGWQYVYTHKE